MSPCPRTADIAVYYLTHLTDHWQRQKIAELDRLFPGRLVVVVPTALRLPLPLSRGSRLVLADAYSWLGKYELSHVRGCNERCRVQASCGDCGAVWEGSRQMPRSLRQACHKHIVFFSNGGCRMYRSCESGWDEATSIFSKTNTSYWHFTLESQAQYGGRLLGAALVHFGQHGFPFAEHAYIIEYEIGWVFADGMCLFRGAHSGRPEDLLASAVHRDLTASDDMQWPHTFNMQNVVPMPWYGIFAPAVRISSRLARELLQLLQQHTVDGNAEAWFFEVLFSTVLMKSGNMTMGSFSAYSREGLSLKTKVHATHFKGEVGDIFHKEVKNPTSGDLVC